MKRSASYWKEKLKMLPHPEGGFFKETYRAEGLIRKEHLSERFKGDRNFSTGIFYLLEKDQCSKFHRIQSDEMWHFYDGDCLIVFEFDEDGNLIENKLGLNIEEGEIPQLTIKAGRWFGARLNKPDTYCLAGCTVSPGFHFDDFEMADRNKLILEFPQNKSIIEKLT